MPLVWLAGAPGHRFDFLAPVARHLPTPATSTFLEPVRRESAPGTSDQDREQVRALAAAWAEVEGASPAKSRLPHTLGSGPIARPCSKERPAWCRSFGRRTSVVWASGFSGNPKHLKYQKILEKQAKHGPALLVGRKRKFETEPNKPQFPAVVKTRRRSGTGEGIMPISVSCLSRSWPQAAAMSCPFSRRKVTTTFCRDKASRKAT